MLLCVHFNVNSIPNLHTTCLYHRQYDSKFYQIFKHWCKFYGIPYDIEFNAHYM